MTAVALIPGNEGGGVGGDLFIWFPWVFFSCFFFGGPGRTPAVTTFFSSFLFFFFFCFFFPFFPFIFFFFFFFFFVSLFLFSVCFFFFFCFIFSFFLLLLSSSVFFFRFPCLLFPRFFVFFFFVVFFVLFFFDFPSLMAALLKVRHELSPRRRRFVGGATAETGRPVVRGSEVDAVPVYPAGGW